MITATPAVSRISARASAPCARSTASSMTVERRRGPWAARRERRRQVDAAAHPVRRLQPTSGHVEVDGQPVDLHGPVAARARRHRHDPPGTAAGSRADRRAEHVPRPSAEDRRRPASSPRRAGAARRRGPCAARPVDRSGGADPHAEGRPAPDRRDRARHDGGRQDPRHGRADVEPDAERVRAPGRADRRAGGARASRSSMSRTRWTRCSGVCQRATILRDGARWSTSSTERDVAKRPSSRAWSAASWPQRAAPARIATDEVMLERRAA